VGLAAINSLHGLKEI